MNILIPSRHFFSTDKRYPKGGHGCSRHYGWLVNRMNNTAENKMIYSLLSSRKRATEAKKLINTKQKLESKKWCNTWWRDGQCFNINAERMRKNRTLGQLIITTVNENKSYNSLMTNLAYQLYGGIFSP